MENNNKETTHLVSIILPVHNGEKHLEQAIQSVLSQTYQKWELIIVDDGSTDQTYSIAQRCSGKDNRIRSIKNNLNLGIQKALNRGILEAKGEYIARIDDDDVWAENTKLEKQINFLLTNPDYVLVGTGTIVVSEEGIELFRYLLPETDKKIRSKILTKNCFVHSSVVFKKDSAQIFGGYDESNNLQHIEDYDLWIKLGTVGKLANLLFYGIQTTLRAGSISSKNKLEQFKKSLNLIRLFKDKYPNYYFALLKTKIKISLYRIIAKLPKSVVYKAKKIYNKNW